MASVRLASVNGPTEMERPGEDLLARLGPNFTIIVEIGISSGTLRESRHAESNRGWRKEISIVIASIVERSNSPWTLLISLTDCKHLPQIRGRL
jgi:hypothetical protein